MGNVDWHASEQLTVTDALIRFLELHDLHVPEPLRKARESFEAGDVDAACRFAYRVKPFGMGSLTDGYPTPKLDHKDPEYCRVVHEALVRYWCYWVSAVDERKSPYWKKAVRAAARFLDPD